MGMAKYGQGEILRDEPARGERPDRLDDVDRALGVGEHAEQRRQAAVDLGEPDHDWDPR
jgi:hypothetical protein